MSCSYCRVNISKFLCSINFLQWSLPSLAWSAIELEGEQERAGSMPVRERGSGSAGRSWKEPVSGSGSASLTWLPWRGSGWQPVHSHIPMQDSEY